MPKVVLVTGGSSGIGEAIATHLSSDPKYKVYATSRKTEHGTVVGNVTFVKLDVNSSLSAKDAIYYVIKKENRIDILINNAGIGFAGPLEHTAKEEFNKVMETNVYGILDLCKEVIPYMRMQGGGRILNVSSLAGRFGLPFRGVYCATKFALEGMSEALSQELMQFGIKVSIIEPGDFATNISENRETTRVPAGSHFESQFEATYDFINKEVAEALPPQYMAKKIADIITHEKPKLRYVISTPFQKLTLVLKALLPGRTFEKLIMNHYKIPFK